MEAWLLHNFRKWLRKYHKDLLDEYDAAPSEFMFIDEWIETSHPHIAEDFYDWLVLEEAGQDHYECLED